MTGIEPIACNYEKSINSKYTVINGFFPDGLSTKHTKTFDFIIFNDVFEHIPDLNKVLSACNNLLKPTGLLIINLPMNTGVFYKIAGFLSVLGKKQSLIRLYQFETESPHVHYFSEKSLRKATEKNKFNFVNKFNLHTVVFDKNIRERVAGIGNMSKLKSLVLTLIILVGVPFLRILPRDTKCFVFKKVKGEID